MENFIEVIWRTLTVFVLLVLLARAIGRKLLSQITFFDFVVGVTIGTISGSYITNRIKGIWILVSLIFLTTYVVITDYLVLKSLRFRKLLEGEPIVIIQNGKILEKNMFKARYHLDDLEMQLREKGVFNLSEVEFAVLEPHGKLSVLKKSSYLPVTPNDLNLKTKYKGMASEIIKDGEVLEQNLLQNNLDFNWLYQELSKQGVDDISNVVLASLNTDGSLYVDVREDNTDYTQEIED